ncbi:MAG TPA: hypothetical protein VHG08_10645 [Longimicrobium sp.]|nr:hypothetical protein [Longimicrobium sp.]
MEFLVLLIFGWVFFSIVRAAARQSQQQQNKLPPPAFFDPSQVPPEHRMEVVDTPAAVLPAGASREESSSEHWWDEVAGDTELDATGAAPAEVVSLESTEVVIPGEVQAPPIVSLEQEVDWEAEHTRFHQRYVDVHPADRTPAHGLMDELRDPATLRRAVLLAEILGPPKSMRGR